MKIKYEKRALKFLAKTERHILLKLREAINGLTESPLRGDIKPLAGYKDGRKRLRSGKYRVIFKYDDDEQVLYIMNIGSRGDIYKED